MRRRRHYYNTGTPAGYTSEAEEIAREYWELSRTRLRIIRIVSILMIGAAAVALLLAIGVIKTGRNYTEPGIKGFELKDIGELATESATFSMTVPVETAREEEIFGYSFTVPGTKNTHYITYNVLIKAGLDFSEIQMSVDGKEHVIRLKLPKVRILSTEVYFSGREGTSNPLSQLSPEEAEKIRKEVIPDAEKTAKDGDIFDKAKESAQNLIYRLLAGAYDMSVYTVDYQWQ